MGYGHTVARFGEVGFSPFSLQIVSWTVRFVRNTCPLSPLTAGGETHVSAETGEAPG